MKFLTIATGRGLEPKRVEKRARSTSSPVLKETGNSVSHASPEQQQSRNGKPPEHGAFMRFIIAIVVQCLPYAGTLELRCNMFVNGSHGSTMERVA